MRKLRTITVAMKRQRQIQEELGNGDSVEVVQEKAAKYARTIQLRDYVLNLPELLAAVMAQMEPADIIRARRVSKLWYAQYIGSKEVRMAAAVMPAIGRVLCTISGEMCAAEFRPRYWDTDYDSDVDFHPLLVKKTVISSKQICLGQVAPFSATWGETNPFRNARAIHQLYVDPMEFVSHPPCRAFDLTINLTQETFTSARLVETFGLGITDAVFRFHNLPERHIVTIWHPYGIRVKDYLVILEKVRAQVMALVLQSCEKERKIRGGWLY